MATDTIAAQDTGESHEPYLIGVYGLEDVSFSIAAVFDEVRARFPTVRDFVITCRLYPRIDTSGAHLS